MSIPKHVAIIMDGNGRWAKHRGHSRVWGHVKGTSKIKSLVRFSDSVGIKYLTLYAFSTENWLRPKAEVTILMKLLKKYLIKERSELIEKNVRLSTIGEVEKLPADVLHELNVSKELTAHNSGLTLNFAFSYGSRQELIRAIKQLIADNPSDVTEELISNYLYTKNIPDPDLLIRTSGEFRLSNFLLWQCAYTEFYITDINWPDFTVDEFKKALTTYQSRERRFGKTSEQVRIQ